MRQQVKRLEHEADPAPTRQGVLKSERHRKKAAHKCKKPRLRFASGAGGNECYGSSRISLRRLATTGCEQADQASADQGQAARLGNAVRPQLPADLAVPRLRALVPLALTARNWQQPARGEEDVVDPYGCDEATYQRSFDQVYRAVHTLLDLAVG